MQKKLATLLVALLTVTLLQAKDPEDSLQNAMDQQLKFIDSVQTALKWQTNTIALPNGIARLKLPAEFKFLNAAQSQFILRQVPSCSLEIYFDRHSCPVGNHEEIVWRKKEGKGR